MEHIPRGEQETNRAGTQKRLAWTLAIVLLYMAAEVVGGILTHSLALLADAGHMLSDAASLGLALFAGWIAQRPRTPERSFGYHRTEILAALANATTLLAIAVVILIEAWGRFRHAAAVDGQPMMWVAVGGLLANLAGLAILHRGRHASLNLRGAWLHVASDALGSVQAIVAGALIWKLGWNWADPVASVIIAGLVIGSAIPLLRETVDVLMESTPGHVDAREVQAALAGIDGIHAVHDLHIWTITSGFVALSVHLNVTGREPGSVLEEARRVLRDRFGIDHSTIQLEGPEGGAHGDCD